jgi:hypothetical protein
VAGFVVGAACRRWASGFAGLAGAPDPVRAAPVGAVSVRRLADSALLGGVADRLAFPSFADTLSVGSGGRGSPVVVPLLPRRGSAGSAFSRAVLFLVANFFLAIALS